jgi:hypothetical protein
VADDIDLPVWTIRPNWRSGILERLSWLTDIMPSTYGTEQRRALRLSPRRAFEISFNPIDAVRSYFDLWLHRLGSDEFMLPLFHDAGRLTADIAGGATVIPFNTAYREFAVGDLAILVGSDPFTFDKLEVTAVGPNSITVTNDSVLRAWGKGSAVHPLRRARLSQESKFAALTNRVGEATLEFELNQANDIADEGAWVSFYAGIPILLDKPNRREALDSDYIRNSLLLDNEIGLRQLLDDAGRAFTIQVHNRMMRGRAEHWAFRQFLYRLRGSAWPLWVPSFNRDLVLSRARLAGDAFVDVNKIGYEYTGGPVDGRRHILIGGAVGKEIDDVDDALSAAEERLSLTAALGTAFPAGTTASFMDICRLSQDDIEINHHTDTEGVAECSIGFRAFRDEREPDETVEYPIPTTALRAVGCAWTPRAICFALDRSSSMLTNNRFVTMKQAMSEVLDMIKLHVEEVAVDIGVVTFGPQGASNGPSLSIIRRGVNAANVDEINDWVQAMAANAFNTDFRVGATAAADFFNGTSGALNDRFLFWLTDGAPTFSNADAPGTALTIATQAAATLNALAVPVLRYGINIDLVDATYTAHIDNTPTDDVPTISGTDHSALINAVGGVL